MLAAANEIGYPVVVKSAHEDITHRQELGLVKLNVPDEKSLVRALDELTEALSLLPCGQAAPAFLVQRFVASGTEAVLVARNGGELGWFAGVGLGGTAIELYEDIAYLPLPCTASSLRDALATLRMAPLWFGYRALPR